MNLEDVDNENDFEFPKTREDYEKLSHEQKSQVCYRLGRDTGKSNANFILFLKFNGIDYTNFMESLEEWLEK